MVGLATKLTFVVIATISFVGCCVMTISGICHMDKNFPNYKPDDFLNDKDENN
jgi:hypothetical protein